MKKLLTAAIAVFILYSCSDDLTEGNNSDSSQQKELLSPEQINKYVDQQLQETGDVDWTNAPAQILWSAAVNGDMMLNIGYGTDDDYFAETKSNEINDLKNQILEIVADKESLTEKEVLIDDHDFFYQLEVSVTRIETIQALQNLQGIRYIDPIGYSYEMAGEQKSNSGCNQSPDNINTADYTNISPGARMPWNFNIHNIDDAWNYSTGSGVTLAVIDTGLTPNNYLMNAGFNDGASTGRNVQRYGNFIDSSWWWSNNVDGPNDRCGHGSQMASVAAAPRNNDKLPVGVAYNSNLVVYRSTEDVVLNDYHERKGVSEALRTLGNRSDVKIISMSIGYVWSIGNIKDAVRYANSRGKLIFAAGGTSTSFTNWYGVIFPASMSETVAVTGIKDNGYNRCDVCHSGSKIDFTVTMQRANNSNRTVPVLGFNTGQQKYVGGSSVATATTAGIAALVWSKNPSWTKTQVLNKLKQSAHFYPNRNSSYGYGNIDALQAVQ
ncbi:hypothetical protein JCM19294_489 [Nonlabens tegetincola]|uniref:Peptidase S8/S53 domain-containing protein n=1 Tax=Nonlabens tegetincola TaxID=323273 RepID=A0A090Q5J8_9FLAO|nr:S8 family serine peptidase [Nonlabens tegetincola]MEE2802747.1 S8 family serine peptidase [Bacteroidota bacterium]GAK96983.1 hypothetical protein JCM19294_489 [Nonlabens tegetincola]